MYLINLKKVFIKQKSNDMHNSDSNGLVINGLKQGNHIYNYNNIKVLTYYKNNKLNGKAIHVSNAQITILNYKNDNLHGYYSQYDKIYRIFYKKYYYDGKEIINFIFHLDRLSLMDEKE